MSSSRTPRTLSQSENTQFVDVAGDNSDMQELLGNGVQDSVRTGIKKRWAIGGVVGLMGLAVVLGTVFRSADTPDFAKVQQFDAVMRKFAAAQSAMPNWGQLSNSFGNNITIGDCVIDIDETMASASAAVLAMSKAQKEGCTESPTNCAIDILEVVGSITKIGDFIAKASTQCANSPIPAAACLAESASILANMIGIGRRALTMNQSCVPAYAEALQQSLSGKFLFDIPNCVVDADLFTAHTAKIAAYMTQLTVSCANQEQDVNKEPCAVDILTLISEMGSSIEFITQAIVQCSPVQFEGVVGVMCAESISALVGDSLGMITALVEIPTCTERNYTIVTTTAAATTAAATTVAAATTAAAVATTVAAVTTAAAATTAAP